MFAVPSLSEKAWKIIGSLTVAAILLLIVLFTLDRCGKARYDTEMQKANANLSNAIDQLSNIQQQKQQLDVEEAVQKEKVIQAAKEANEAAKKESEAANETNQALNNLNAINNRNFNGTGTDNANRERCLTFPDSDDCKR